MIKSNNTSFIYIKNKFLLTSMIVFIFQISCIDHAKQTMDQTEETNKIGIILIDQSVMRLDPIIYSSIVKHISIGEKVNIVDQSKKKAWIGKGEDYWYKVTLSKGFVGWIFGRNIKIFSANDVSNIEDFLSEFWKVEFEKLRRKLTGMWGTIETKGKFVSQGLDIFNDGKYRSYNSESDVIEGKYIFDHNQYEIVFLSGTYFGSRINYRSRGNRYFLKKTTNASEIKFKKISRKIKNLGTDTTNEKRKDV